MSERDGAVEALRSIAVHMVRFDGGCESGHRAGQWHMHADPFHAIGRRLAAIAAEAAAPATFSPDPACEYPNRICICDPGTVAQRFPHARLAAQQDGEK